MKFKSLATVGILLAAALVPLGVSTASANTYGGETCTPAEAWTEVIEHPAVGEPTITTPNPDYVPAIPGTPAQGEPTISVEVSNPDYKPAVPAVTKTEYLYKQLVTGKEKWMDSLTWNPGLGWYYAHQERTTEVTPAQPAVGTPTIWVDQPNPYYVPEVPGVPAVGEPTISTPNPDYVEARTETVEHPAVTCPAPPAHNANGKATCGAWDITLYNVQAEGYKNQTASYVVYIDGKFNAAYAVAANKTEAISGTFPEDSGNHQVIVRSGPAQGDKIVFSLDVTSDCIAPQPKDAVVIGEWSKPVITCDSKVGDVVTITREVSTTEYVLSENGWVPGDAVITAEEDTYTVTADDIKALKCAVVVPPVEKPTAKPVKAAAVSDSTLAQTGGVVSPWLVGGGIAALLAAAGIRIASRQR